MAFEKMDMSLACCKMKLPHYATVKAAWDNFSLEVWSVHLCIKFENQTI